MRRILICITNLHSKKSSCTLAQENYITRPFENTGLQMLDRRIFDLLVGITYLTECDLFIQRGGIEDFHDSIDAGADITFFLNMGRHF